MRAAVSAWRTGLEITITCHAALPFAMFAQVATVRADGRPANRTLTFRFFLSGDRLLFTADSRTEKIDQIEANPWAEVCWYFTESHTQFRLLGKIQRIVDTRDKELLAARERTWQERTEKSRQSFTWPKAGRALAGSDAFLQPAPVQPPATFAMLVFSPERVEILNLCPQPHEREVFRLEQQMWISERINP